MSDWRNPTPPEPGGKREFTRAENAFGNAVVALVVLVVLAVAYFLLTGCYNFFAGDEEDGVSWCQQMDEWYAENPYDSNPTLLREYTLRC